MAAQSFFMKGTSGQCQVHTDADDMEQRAALKNVVEKAVENVQDLQDRYGVMDSCSTRSRPKHGN